MSNGTPPPPPGAPAAKKGLSTWAWVAIGCGGIIIVCMVAFIALGAFVFKKGKEVAQEVTGADSVQEMIEKLEQDPLKTVAETAIRVNPDLELRSTDDEAGTVTFFNTKTGEEATLNFEDIAEGRFSMTTDEGEYKIDASDEAEGAVTFSGPDGQKTRFGASADLSAVPNWAAAYPGLTDRQSTMHSAGGNGVMGAFTGKTQDDAQAVVEHYKQVFTDAGYKIGSESVTRTGEGAFGAINADLGDGRSVNVVAMEGGGQTSVTVNYNQKKP